MKNTLLLTVALCTIATLLYLPSAHADISSSTLTPLNGYISGETNTLVYRCDCVTPDYEYMYTVQIEYLTGMDVLAGYSAYGEVNGGSFSYDGSVGDAAIARWDSDENLGVGYGSLVNGESGYFTNDVAVSSSVTGSVVLAYTLTGDGYGSAPHTISSTLTLQQLLPNVSFDPNTYTGSAFPSNEVTHTLHVMNDTGAADSFDLAYTSGVWGETAPANTGVIADGGMTDIVVTVMVPADVLAGVASTTTVMATGATDPSFTAQATVITKSTWTDQLICETFDGIFPPVGWTQYLLADATNGWEYWSVGNPDPGMRHPTIPELSSNWFVSPLLDLQSDVESFLLTFDESMWNTSAYTYTGVMISDSTRDPLAGGYTELLELTPHNEGYYWDTHTIDITSYKGGSVYIAFLYIGTNGHRPYIDNICVKGVRTGIDNAQLVSPATISQYSYSNSPVITAGLTIAGETGSAGPASDITCQIGYGPAGTDVTTWEWTDASYDSSDADSDYYTAIIAPTTAGDQEYACRFRKGGAEWVYGDLDGSTNGFDYAQAGQMDLMMLPPLGSLIYEQTLDFDALNGLVDYSNATLGVNAIMADDLTPTAGMTLRTIRWCGFYSTVRDDELGFMLNIFTNDPAGGNSPGGVMYQQYRPGYNCEIPTNSSYYYSLDLTTPVFLAPGQTYWISVQLVTAGERWNIGMTTDPVSGNEAMLRAPSFGVFQFTSMTDLGVGASDIGMQLYGEKEDGVYFNPEKQSSYGRVGTTVNYTEELQNKTVYTNNYALSYSSDWTVSGPVESGTLLPGVFTNLTIDVTVPGLIPPGVVVTTTVTAVGIDNNAYTNSCIIITESAWNEYFYCQDFDGSWLPTGWGEYELGDPAGWMQTSPGEGGVGSCAFHADDNVATGCDDWLVSPAVTLTPGFSAYTLSFDHYIAWPTYYDASKVLVSTNSPDPADGDFIELLDVGDTDTDWTRREIDLSAFEGSTIYVAFEYMGDYAHQWFVDNMCVRGDSTPPQGTITGLVTKAYNGAPLANATVTATTTGGEWSATTAADGTYSISAVTGAYDITASAANCVTQSVSGIDVAEGATVAQNFALVGSVLTYGPLSLYEAMELGDVVTNTVTVTNSGPFDLDVDLTLGNFSAPTVFALAGGLTCYGPDINNDNVVSWDTTDPGTLTTVGTTTDDIYGSAFIDGDYSTMYGVTAGGNLVTVNLVSGTVTIIGALTAQSGDIVSDITQDPTDGTVYACATDLSTSRLYTLDTASGACTLIGQMSNSSFALSISVDSAGNMYLLDGADDSLHSVNKATGADTVIGSLGYDANYIQGMSFSPDDDTLYIAAYNYTDNEPQLRIGDTTTGNSTLVGTLGDGSGNISSICIVPSVVPDWLKIETNALTCVAGGTATFDIIFDATTVSNEGAYGATCSFEAGFINEPGDMPLTMDIIPEPGTVLFVLCGLALFLRKK